MPVLSILVSCKNNTNMDESDDLRRSVHSILVSICTLSALYVRHYHTHSSFLCEHPKQRIIKLKL
jgi:hypothetical protein